MYPKEFSELRLRELHMFYDAYTSESRTRVADVSKKHGVSGATFYQLIGRVEKAAGTAQFSRGTKGSVLASMFVESECTLYKFVMEHKALFEEEKTGDESWEF